jgi:hypothetical protein
MELILQNLVGGLACFLAGTVLGYVIKALGGISGIATDVATLKSDVKNLKVQSPIVVATPVVQTPVATVAN